MLGEFIFVLLTELSSVDVCRQNKPLKRALLCPLQRQEQLGTNTMVHCTHCPNTMVHYTHCPNAHVMYTLSMLNIVNNVCD